MRSKTGLTHRERSSLAIRVFWFMVFIACLAFSFKALTLINTTSLWNDELMTVVKSFQESPMDTLDFVRNDPHPPLYYLLIWTTGKLFGETVATLRVFSWFFYVLGGIILAKTVSNCNSGRLAVATALILSFSLPFTVRYSIEGKAYSLLYCMAACALFFRNQLLVHSTAGDNQPTYDHESKTSSIWGYAISMGLMGLTHYYGFIYALLSSALDLLFRKWRIGLTSLVALLPTSLWIVANWSYLGTDKGRDWIATPGAWLFRSLLSTTLGPRYQSILTATIILLLIMLAIKSFDIKSNVRPANNVIQRWSLDTSFALLALTVGLSFFKPISFPRYYIVLLPSVIGGISEGIGALTHGDHRRDRLVSAVNMMVLAALVIVFWNDSFVERLDDPKETIHRSNQEHRDLSLAAANYPAKFTANAHKCDQLNASDLVLINANIVSQASSWTCAPSRWEENDEAREKFAEELGEAVRSKGSVVIGDVDLGSFGTQTIDRAGMAAEDAGMTCRTARISKDARMIICTAQEAPSDQTEAASTAPWP